MLLVLAVVTGAATVFAATASAGTGLTIISRGISSFQASPQGTPTGAQSDEISGLDESDADAAAGDDEGGVVNRTIPSAHVSTGGPSVIGGKKAKSNPEVQTGWDGLDFFDQRFANNGNQFSVEPPDQPCAPATAMCSRASTTCSRSSTRRAIRSSAPST